LATIDGSRWQPDTAYATLEDSIFLLSASYQTRPDIAYFYLLRIRATPVPGFDDFVLADTTSSAWGAFVIYPEMIPTPITFPTTAASGGQLILTEVRLVDSLVAGRFDFTVVSPQDASPTYHFHGTFRVPLDAPLP
jgi:hypothetical protein